MTNKTIPTVEELTVDGLVTRASLIRLVGVPLEGMNYAVSKNLITPTDVRKGSGQKGGGLTFTVDDARTVITAQRFASAYGLAFVTMLRLVRDRKAYVDEKNRLVLRLP